MPQLGQPNSATERKSKQQLLDEISGLRHVVALHAGILDIAGDAIISIDENHKIVRFNQGAARIFGYLPQEITGEPLGNLVPVRYRGEHSKHLENFAAAETPARLMGQRGEIIGLRKDGTEFPARASVSRFELGGEIALTAYLTDLSELRRAEDAARKSQDELAQLTRIGLLGEISNSLAHELNQPLAAILTNAQALTLQIDADPTDFHAYLETVRETVADVVDDARRAGKVIERLRTLLTSSEQKVEIVDINQLVGAVHDLLRSECIMRQTNLEIELHPDLPKVSGDRIRLQQVLLNLMSNAFDAMDGMDPTDRHLVVRTSQAGPGAVEISVSDTGTGFAGEPYRRLLEPFYTTKDQGLGMGLAISSTIMQAHGGRLWGENNQDRGATFYITVPMTGTVAAAADELLAPARGQSLEFAESDAAAESETVFIVDDDPSIRRSMARLLESNGYTAEVFSSAEEFVRRDHYDGYGCLLVDLYMPGETGLDLQEMLLESHEYVMPVIFITGAGDTSSGVRAMKQGALDFLIKPVENRTLLDAVARAIDIDHRTRDRHEQVVTASERVATLTPREGEIMDLVVQGLRNKQIAGTLGISEKIVKAHRGRVMEKVRANSVTDLVRISQSAAEIQ